MPSQSWNYGNGKDRSGIIATSTRAFFFFFFYDTSKLAEITDSAPTHSNPQYNGDEFQRSVYKPN